MNTVVTDTIVGTGQQRPKTITTGKPLDSLLEHLPSDDIERKLLLAAGAWSLYRQAWSSTAHLAIDLDVARNETLAGCSSTIADLIVTMLSGEYANLLPEALDHLQRAGQRLPYTLLPEVLDYG